jgi:Domain of unknown function (DUF4347)
VWADSGSARGIICFDARLESGSWKGAPYPEGSTRGQAGWDVGIRFGDLANLASKLKTDKTPSHVCGNWWRDCPPIRPGQIYRLAISGHGAPGIFQTTSTEFLDASNVTTTHKSTLEEIDKMLSDDAIVLLTGCNSGKGSTGSLLLQELSKIWQGKKVVCFTKVMTYGWGRMRSGASCSEPGMRITEYDQECYGSEAQRENCERERYSPIWQDLKKLPWGSEYSSYAKIALNGTIIQDPEKPVVPKPSLERYSVHNYY